MDVFYVKIMITRRYENGLVPDRLRRYYGKLSIDLCYNIQVTLMM